MSRDVVAAMTAYTLELREAEIKLNQNEGPVDFPRELKAQVLARIVERPGTSIPTSNRCTCAARWRRCMDTRPTTSSSATARTNCWPPRSRRSSDPARRWSFRSRASRCTKSSIAVAGGIALPIAVDPATGLLPLDDMLRAIERCDNAVVIVCSPNNPTGGVLPDGGIDALLATGATVLFDRAYGDFAEDRLPPLHDRLVTFSTFSKAWGLAGLRVGWLASTASTCREIRKVKLPYSLNIISEAVAATALEHPEIRDAQRRQHDRRTGARLRGDAEDRRRDAVSVALEFHRLHDDARNAKDVFDDDPRARHPDPRHLRGGSERAARFDRDAVGQQRIPGGTRTSCA